MSTKADGLHSFKEQRTTIDGKTTLYYICEYCGKSAGEVGEEAYQEQVSTLPAAGFTSAGHLIWQPTFANVSDFVYYHRYGHASAFSACTPFSSNLGFVYNRDGISTLDGFAFELKNFPIDGMYLILDSSFFSYRFYNSNAQVVSGFFDIDHSSWFRCTVTSSPLFRTSGSFPSFPSSGLISFEITLPRFEIAPDTVIDFNTGSQYNITTRPTTITGGNYGIVGDDNNITTVTNTTQIVNEGDNLYYNPATGQTQTITDWSYNYDGRIYNITLDTGDTVSVEYGDENITIVENTVNEGDTIVNNYTIYYMIDGSGSGDNPSPTPCPHDWQAGSSTTPTCTAPGKTAYTCSKCGETKTETVPALGHDWEVVRTVPTEYDDNGLQTQAGYTLYECTLCGEQYKDTDSTGPPGDDTPEDGGLIAWLNGLIKSLSDNLSGVVDLILRFFTEIPALFGGFTAFLAAVFPFLPDEITLLLTFGMAALVVVGVIKAIRR